MNDTTNGCSVANGGVTDTNGLFHTNWFNGRFLTAEALRSQDLYWEERTRLLARIHPPGIAWGLGVRVKGAESQCIRLERGLAFDGAGQPILVGKARDIQLNKLIAKSLPARVVVGGGTQFAPCVCLAPPESVVGRGGGDVPQGVYLLLIESYQRMVGEAKVYGEVCARPTTVRCEAEGRRGGYRLSLGRLDVDLGDPNVEDVWARRGLLSAYYFDVYEHNLNARWTAGFAQKEDFCKGAGPFEEMGEAVPLAMLYLNDGELDFLDPWIPRRPLISTQAAGWSANLLGAPTPAAAVARGNQFQCQLAESCSANVEGESSFANLHERGFRHIPPVGFLPLEGVAFDEENGEACPDLGIASKLSGALSQTGYSSIVAKAEKRVCQYFRGTNIFPFYTVAAFDDDILEDIRRSFEKDPIVVLEQDPGGKSGEVATSLLDFYLKLEGQGSEEKESSAFPWIDIGAWSRDSDPRLGKLAATLLLALVDAVRKVLGPSLNSLASRELTLVKIIIPLQRTASWHPLVGRIRAGGAGMKEAQGELVARPHDFVAYVKQRVVLLDAVFVFLDLLEEVAEELEAWLCGTSKRDPRWIFFAFIRPFLVGYWKFFQKLFPLAKIQERWIKAVLEFDPSVLTMSWKQFWGEVAKQEAEIGKEVVDKAQARTNAIQGTMGSWARKHPFFADLGWLFVVLPLEQVEAVLQGIERAVEQMKPKP